VWVGEGGFPLPKCEISLQVHDFNHHPLDFTTQAFLPLNRHVRCGAPSYHTIMNRNIMLLRLFFSRMGSKHQPRKEDTWKEKLLSV